MARAKVPSVDGIKLLVVQPLDHHQHDIDRPLVACDVVQAGPGDLIFYETGREAALALPEPFNPVDATITGIVDQIDVEQHGDTAHRRSRSPE